MTPVTAETESERCQLLEHETESYHRDGRTSNGFELGDPRNPLNWSPSMKRGIVMCLTAAAFMVTFTCMSVVPIANTIVIDLATTNPLPIPAAPNTTTTRTTTLTTNPLTPLTTPSTVLPITIWEFGEALGPLLIAPFSELFGRAPVFHTANALFFLSTILSACSPSMPLFIASRALTGLSVASNVLGPAIVGDVFVPEQRGGALSIVGVAPLLGGTAGPVVGGLLAELMGWRAVLGACVGLAGVVGVGFVVWLRETYAPVILQQKKKSVGEAMGKGGGLESGKGGKGGYGAVSVSHPGSLFWASIVRPASVLCSSGVMVGLSLFSSAVYAHFYILATTLPTILSDRYGLSPSATGSAFLFNGIGSYIAILVCRTWLDKIYVKLRDANNGVGLPEFRLPIAIFAAFLMPAALLLYGWSAEYTLPLPFILVSIIGIRMSMTMINVPVMVYVVDACGIYSASAFTGITVIRSLAGAFLPLGTAGLIHHLGFGWGYTALSMMNLVLAVVPVLLLKYGSKWRKSSPYTQA
ncbi:putative transporter [Dichotomopilus funicola]|uniref:Transporter n=1 Tax=Dichotomopilus funicola TaxID=1934379 RepID=A0AAN6UXP7_9PEZI|nr:putative transporter [Dichotomopilus funicola]